MAAVGRRLDCFLLDILTHVTVSVSIVQVRTNETAVAIGNVTNVNLRRIMIQLVSSPELGGKPIKLPRKHSTGMEISIHSQVFCPRVHFAAVLCSTFIYLRRAPKLSSARKRLFHSYSLSVVEQCAGSTRFVPLI